jgi:hypothetical protein
VRKLLPMVAVLALAAAVAAPARAQFSLTNLTGSSTPQTSASLPTTAGITQMLPKYNINNTMQAGAASSRTFNFAKMLPNFSSISNRWPLNLGRSQIPASATINPSRK